MSDPVSPELLKQVALLRLWKDVHAEPDGNLIGDLVAKPGVYFLAGNDDFDPSIDPSVENPWVVGLYQDPADLFDGGSPIVLDFSGPTVSIEDFVAALGALTRSFLKGEVKVT